MFKFYIKKCYTRRTFSSETKQNFCSYFFFCARVYVNFGTVWSVSNQGSFAPYLTTLTSWLQRHLTYYQDYTQIFFLKLQKSEEILEIRNSRFQNFEKINLII